MKKKLFRITSLLLIVFMVLPLGGCGKKLEVTDEEKSQGYKGYRDMGIKFKMGEDWKKYDDNIFLDGLGDSEDENEPIYNGISYGYISNDLIEQYLDIAENVADEQERFKRYDEIFSQVKNIFSIVVFRENKIPAEDKISELTNMSHNEKTNKKSGYVFYFCYNDFDDSELDEEEKNIYKNLYNDIQNIKTSLETYKPETPQEALTSIKKLEFNLKDLDGNEVNNEIFKDYNLTMINIWGTFCGPCKREMPDLAELYEEMKDENVNIIGIISDTPNEDNENAAREIIKESGVKYTNLISDENIKKNVINCIAGVPTSFFVDSQGNIVGEVITGSMSKDEYKEKISETLKLLK